ncbi:hypothetical protein AB1N83_014134 [Pleurotus pulmonarius]
MRRATGFSRSPSCMKLRSFEDSGNTSSAGPPYLSQTLNPGVIQHAGTISPLPNPSVQYQPFKTLRLRSHSLSLSNLAISHTDLNPPSHVSN